MALEKAASMKGGIVREGGGSEVEGNEVGWWSSLFVWWNALIIMSANEGEENSDIQGEGDVDGSDD